MRPDALGFFWRDEPVVKVKKEPPPKRTPPRAFWREPTYLPGLQEALAFQVHVMDDEQLQQAAQRRETLIFDIEVYQNYFLAAFTSYETGWVAYVEMSDEEPELDINRLGWIVTNFKLVGFNSINYDLPLICMALAGKTCDQIKTASDKIIIEECRPSDVLRSYKVKSLREHVDHTDLIEVAPLSASLKIYGGRLHTPRMQDLPFHHTSKLTFEQRAIVRWYCVNDLTQTAFLKAALREELQLREEMSAEYGVDLRSKSDAQIAEAVIAHELERMNRRRPERPDIAPGTVFQYQVPQFIQYATPLMQYTLDVVRNARFVIGEDGSVPMPPQIRALKIQIANNAYQMGIGGLHSSETTAVHIADKDTVIVDRDVTSYYPEIIRRLQLYPVHLGRNFLIVYSGIVDRRVKAKQEGKKAIANSLKIVVNGSFGKLGSKWSIFYSPNLLIQVTITGQLSLLMLIERVELLGIQVISANTDGVVIKCPVARRPELEALIKQWEQDTGFTTEETEYSAYYGRDVNNYIAVKKPDKDGKTGTKNKGAYANPWNDPKASAMRLHKNPTNTICIDAVEALLTKNIPVADTIRGCTDIQKFVSVRKVKGGAVKDDQFLGSSIRWYYATGVTGEIIYASSGNKVPRSDGAKPVMQLPETFPEDVDHDWYIHESESILRDIGYLGPE
jgi:hypothetical protein